MRSTWLILPLFFAASACGGTTSTPPIDASSDQAATGDAANDGSTGDGSVKQDGATADSSTDDSSIPYEAGSLDQCNPNVPSSCAQGKKCCSEPTHQVPMSAYMCVTPPGNGGCPALP
jgi:hypothetical protein